MISCPTVRKDLIRSHYNLATPFYWLLWGRHLHHGLWEGSETPARAQQQLTETLAREARIRGGERVLDVGCGMGGSSIFLAKSLGCRVEGLTISPVQRAWATAAAMRHRVSAHATFRCADAEAIEFDAESFDVVWSIECTEHLFDKPAFFRRVSRWLRPDGRVAICAWQCADGALDPDGERIVADVCDAFLCPSLGSRADYEQWLTQAGLHVDRYFDWTSRVSQTWEICLDRVRRSGVRWLARWIDRHQSHFLNHFETILKAYHTGAMTYGCWIASRAK